MAQNRTIGECQSKYCRPGSPDYVCGKYPPDSRGRDACEERCQDKCIENPNKRPDVGSPGKPREEVTPFSAFMSLMTLNGQFDFTEVVNVLSGSSVAEYETDKKFPTPPTSNIRPKKRDGIIYDEGLPCRMSLAAYRKWRDFLNCVKDCENMFNIRDRCKTALSGGGTNPLPGGSSCNEGQGWNCFSLEPYNCCGGDPNGPMTKPPTKPEFPCGCPDQPYCGSDECVENKCKELTGDKDCGGDPGLKLAAQFSCFDCANCSHAEESECWKCAQGLRQNCTEGNQWGAAKCPNPFPQVPREQWPTSDYLDSVLMCLKGLGGQPLTDTETN